MAKRGYKLQEFVAHSANVNCLNIGKKACRMFVTGGDDHNVNLWSIGKPNSLMSLSGHTSPVEAVAFDSAEVLVLAGASTGAIKLWDLEEVKMVRTLTGHRSNCTAVEFHPFGEFFASGSADTNLRIWDIRKKGCIHTYRGHTRGIGTIRFTPDGRWVVSGGNDNVVKVWDLTAGKLLHEFQFHEGHIRSLDFHPLEFLLVTGSADNTVKFWDLETFELIGSTRPEATGVRAMAFHPDGRTLFCGLDDSLKVYSWEPVICHDTVDVGWSTLGDLCIHEGKLLGCSSYRDSVAVWVADALNIEPYKVGFAPEESNCTKKSFNILKSDSPEKVRSVRRMSPDNEIKEIKNIYIDSAGANLVSSQKVGSLSSLKMDRPFNLKESDHPSVENKNPTVEVNAKFGGEALNKTSLSPTIIPQDIPTEKAPPKSEKETVTFSRTKPGMLLRPAHVRRPSNCKSDIEKLADAIATETLANLPLEKESVTDKKSQISNISEDGVQKSCEEKSSNIKNVAKIEIKLPQEAQSFQENCEESVDGSKGNAPVKIVNGVAVVSGRTRSLVERFERREKFSKEDPSMDMASQTVPEVTNRPATPTTSTPLVAPEVDRKPPLPPGTSPRVIPEPKNSPTIVTLPTPHYVPEINRLPPLTPGSSPRIIPETKNSPTTVTLPTPHFVPEMDENPSPSQVPRPQVIPASDITPSIPEITIPQVMPVIDRTPSMATVASPRVIPETQATVPKMRYRNTPQTERKHVGNTFVTPRVMARADRSPPTSTSLARRVRSPPAAINVTPRVRSPPMATNLTPRVRSPPTANETRRNSSPPLASNMTPCVIREVHVTPSKPEEEPQSSGRGLNAIMDISETILQTHDVVLSTLKSRLTKLQVVRHFWERGDIKGALNALRKLPDHSVQADVISVLIEKLEIFTLDLFSSFLPVLVGLLDSKTERHTSISLEMLVKLVAVFGSVVSSTVSAPRVVGIDLHAEERLECCKHCSVHLQIIEQMLPALIQRGGLLAKSAMELNLVLQE